MQENEGAKDGRLIVIITTIQCSTVQAPKLSKIFIARGYFIKGEQEAGMPSFQSLVTSGKAANNRAMLYVQPAGVMEKKGY